MVLELHRLTLDQARLLYADVAQSKDCETLRDLCRRDLFFLLIVGLGRSDANRQWLYDRCREVEANPNGYLDLWAREHYKSTIITLAMTIQDVLKDPEITVGIFSHTRGISKAFLAQIMREFESNEFLKALFPDVLFAEPKKQSPRWSLDEGIIVRRKGNPKEATIEAWGLVDGQPTSKHYGLMVYDDVVTVESVSTPEQIAKTTQAWELSLNLGSDGGRTRYVGTRYHANDSYRTILARGSATPRLHAATDDGTAQGNPVLFTSETWAKRKRDMGPYVLACQMLQNPISEGFQSFKRDWLNHYVAQPHRDSMTIYILVDPAGEKKKGSDYTVILTVGLGADGNYYLLDAIRDRMNLTERASKVFQMVQRWKPVIVAYEKYGLQSDIEHIRHVQEQRNYRFAIMPIAGTTSKVDRIKRMVPVFEQNRMWFPVRLIFVDIEGKVRDFVREFIDDEYTAFPVSTHDDMLDCLSRIVDPALGATFPRVTTTAPLGVFKQQPDQANTDYDMFAVSSGHAFA